MRRSFRLGASSIRALVLSLLGLLDLLQPAVPRRWSQPSPSLLGRGELASAG